MAGRGWATGWGGRWRAGPAAGGRVAVSGWAVVRGLLRRATAPFPESRPSTFPAADAKPLDAALPASIPRTESEPTNQNRFLYSSHFYQDDQMHMGR